MTGLQHRDIEYDYILKELFKLHPPPFYLEQRNNEAVIVNDSTGNVVFMEDFGSIPDEMPTSEAVKIRMRASAVASFLVKFSEIEYQIRQLQTIQ